MISISVADGAGLQNYDAVLEHIYNTHRATNTVKESWLNAICVNAKRNIRQE